MLFGDAHAQKIVRNGLIVIPSHDFKYLSLVLSCVER